MIVFLGAHLVALQGVWPFCFRFLGVWLSRAVTHYHVYDLFSLGDLYHTFRYGLGVYSGVSTILQRVPYILCLINDFFSLGFMPERCIDVPLMLLVSS